MHWATLYFGLLVGIGLVTGFSMRVATRTTTYYIRGGRDLGNWATCIRVFRVTSELLLGCIPTLYYT